MSELTRLMRGAYSKADGAGEIAISARSLAEHVYPQIDPNSRAPLLVRESCMNDLRRRAEAVLRQRHIDEQEALESAQVDAFPLQTRYPCEREGVLCYVPPMEMTDEEIDHWVERLEKEITAKQAHADALRAYRAGRNSSGSA